MEIKCDGRLLTKEELFDEALDKLIDELDSLSDYELLELTNEIRDREGYDPLYENNEDELNDALDGEDPYTILRMGYDREWDEYDSYFKKDSWGSLITTNDPWYDLDENEIANDLLSDSGYSYLDLPCSVQDIIDEYNEAVKALENYNPYRAMCEEVIKKYVNCEADVTDLLQTLDKLARTDEAWASE